MICHSGRVRRSWSGGSQLLAILIFLAGAAVFAAPAESRDPPAPPGLDPGGVAVAIADVGGIDYLDVELAARLARDGEGEPIAWDFAEQDPRPYAAAARDPVLAAFLAGAPRTRLVYLRTATETLALGQTVAFAGQSPARILLFLAQSPDAQDWAAFAEAARFFEHLLIITPASAGPATVYPAGLELTTLLRVAATGADGTLPAGLDASAVDAVVPIGSRHAGAVSNGTDAGAIAAASVAAVAASILEVEPELVGSALKERVLGRMVPGRGAGNRNDR